MEDIDRYTTRNLNLASFLAASGLQLIGTRKTNNSLFFEFAPEDKARSLVDSYFKDIAVVNPKTLFSKLNELRDLIFQLEGEDYERR